MQDQPNTEEMNAEQANEQALQAMAGHLAVTAEGIVESKAAKELSEEQVKEEVKTDGFYAKMGELVHALSVGVAGPENPNLQAETYNKIKEAMDGSNDMGQAARNALIHSVNMVYAQRGVNINDMREKRQSEVTDSHVNETMQDSAVNGPDQENEEEKHAAEDKKTEHEHKKAKHKKHKGHGEDASLAEDALADVEPHAEGELGVASNEKSFVAAEENRRAETPENNLAV